MSAGLTETIVAWQSKGLSNEKISLLTTADYNLSSKRKCHSSKIRMRVEFKGKCSKQEKVTFTLSNVVNLFYCLWIRWMITVF